MNHTLAERRVLRSVITGESLLDIAADFPVTMQSISRIARFERWVATVTLP